MNKYNSPWRYDNIPGKDKNGFPHHLHRIGDAENLPVAEILYTGTRDHPNARLIALAPEMVEALEDVDLRCTQARIASTIGKGKNRSDFLRGELERIAAVARALLAKLEE